MFEVCSVGAQWFQIASKLRFSVCAEEHVSEFNVYIGLRVLDSEAA